MKHLRGHRRSRRSRRARAVTRAGHRRAPSTSLRCHRGVHRRPERTAPVLAADELVADRHRAVAGGCMAQIGWDGRRCSETWPTPTCTRSAPRTTASRSAAAGCRTVSAPAPTNDGSTQDATHRGQLTGILHRFFPATRGGAGRRTPGPACSACRGTGRDRRPRPGERAGLGRRLRRHRGGHDEPGRAHAHRPGPRRGRRS